MTENINQKLEQVARDLAQSQKTSPTQIGEAETPVLLGKDAINQVFTLFRLNYHNQFYKAYSGVDELKYAKKLWFTSLQTYSDEVVLAAAERAVRESEFLPTVRGILKYCEEGLSELGLPTPRQAYLEACRAPSPKQQYNWSHPAVYLAGKASDWFFLASNNEKAAFPVFSARYKDYCQRVQRGETLSIGEFTAIEKSQEPALSTQEQREHMNKLREELGW
ncbi:MAG: replication protein P [Pseudomonadales bacterium]